MAKRLGYRYSGKANTYGKNTIKMSELITGDKFKFLNGRKVYERTQTTRFIPRGVVAYVSGNQQYFVEPEKAKKVTVVIVLQ